MFLLLTLWGGGGDGGDDVHAKAASVLCFSCCVVFCALVGRWGDAGVSHRFFAVFS